MSVFNSSTIDKIKKGIADYIADYKFDISYISNMNQYLKNKNLKSIEIPNCTIQALFALATCIKEECAYSLLENGGFTYKKNNKLYTIAYYQKATLLFYEKHDNKFRQERTNIIKICEKMQKIQQQEIINKFILGEASIFNHLERDIVDIHKHEIILTAECAKTTQVPSKEAFIDLMIYRKAFKWSFEIKSFILNTFSLIEYAINCLLPFWEQENGEDWKTFLAKCKDINPNINTWTDLYNPEKVSYKKKTYNNQDIMTPAFINVVNIGMEILEERNPEKKLNTRYLNMKKTYRNMLTHGELGTSFTYGLTLSRPSVTEIENDQVQLFDNVINLDWNAYLHVAEFLDDFLEFCEQEYPGYWAYIMSAQDIPIRPIEYFKYTNGELEKTKAYTRYLTLLHTFKNYEHIKNITCTEKSEEAAHSFFIESLKIYYDNTDIENLSEKDLYYKFIQELLTLQDKLNIPDVLGIREILEELESAGNEKTHEMQLDIIHMFKRIAPDTFGKCTDEEMLNMDYETALDMLENSHFDFSQLTEKDAPLFTDEEFDEYNAFFEDEDIDEID